ncbi:MAG: ChrR family anti-sigma-E factor, partial [Limibacillus sp.]
DDVLAGGPGDDSVSGGPGADILLGGALANLDWKSRGTVSEVNLLPQSSGVRTKLLRIRAGSAIPQHTHEGAEITMVLSGGFTDEHGHYLRGDVSVADNQIEHRPVADPGEDCLCITVTDAPLRFTGPVGRWLNMFVRF